MTEPIRNHSHSGNPGDGGEFDASNLGSGVASYGELLTGDGIGGTAFGTNQWQDINLDGLSFAAGASAPDLISIFASGNIVARGFDGVATAEQLFTGAEILHDWEEATSLTVHIHWMPTTADAGNVKWQLEYSWADVTGVFDAPTTTSVTTAAAGVAWTHQKSSITVAGTGKHMGSHFVVRLFRDPADVADTYAQDAAFLALGIHYKVNTLGSHTETSKT